MSVEPNYKGSCLCGAIKLEISDEAKWTSNCHCPSCQKATSAAFATFVGFEKAVVAFTEGKPKVFNSSVGVKRSFCGNCGSPVSFEGEAWPGEIHIHAMILDKPAELEPGHNTYVRNRMPWVELDPDVPAYDTFPHDKD